MFSLNKTFSNHYNHLMPVKPVLYSQFIKHKRSNTLYDKQSYKNIRTSMVMLCTKHLHTYRQIPHDHIKGHNGCEFCQTEFKYNNKIKSHEQFINEAMIIHGDRYKYPEKYKGATIKIKIICPKHGKFYQKPSTHITQKSGCPNCFGNIIKTKNEFIRKANIKHSNKYCYDDTNMGINGRVKINIMCFDHGIFYQSPKDHLIGRGCPKCKTSKGEFEIRKILIKYSIKFVEQFKFTDCKHINFLYFDFKIKNLPICIEFDGRQHTEPVSKFGGLIEFKKIKLRDSIKNNYCRRNNIKLFRISYKNNFLKTLNKIIEYIKNENINK